MTTPYDVALARHEGRLPCEACGFLTAPGQACPSCCDRTRLYADAEHDGRDPPKPPPFSLIGPAEDLWAPLVPPTYDVAGVIPSASLGLISGYSSSLKSWIAFDLALAIASGTEWLAHPPFRTVHRAVTILEREAGPYECKRRLHALRAGRGIIPDPSLDLCSFPQGTIFDPDFVRRLSELAAQRGLLVLDTLAAFSVGVDENTAAMADGLGRLAEVVHATQCAIAVVAHEKKRGKDGDVDPRERVRGSSSIFGAVDWVLSLQRPSPRDPVEITQTKARNGREADPFTVAMIEEPGAGVRWRVATQASEPRPLSKYDQLRDDILSCVRANPGCARSRIETDVRGRAVAIREALEDLVEAGEVARLGTDTRPVYRLRGAT